MLDRVLMGWGHALAFCTKRDSFEVLDQKIDERLLQFRRAANQLVQRKNTKIARRVMGVHLLSDTPVDPLF